MNNRIALYILLLLLSFNLKAEDSIDKITLINELKSLFSSKEAKNISWGVSIVDTNSNEKIFSLNEDKQFRPASNMKILIAASALKALGSGYKFTTKLYADGKVENNKLIGNLVILGDGDPTFTSSNLNTFIESLKKHRISEITGSLIGIDSIFDEERLGILWSWENLSNCYSAQISGLQINANCVEIEIRPNGLNSSANILANPYVKIINKTKTTEEKTNITFRRTQNTNDIEISGNINIKESNIKRWISIDNPSMYFLTLFSEMLKKNNIKINGKIQIAEDTGYKLDIKKAYLISSHESISLKEINETFLQHSINLYGESLLKKIGFIYFNEGSTHNGRLAIGMIFKNYGLIEEDIFIADGSGLSRLNLITPRYMSGLLYHITNTPFYQDFTNSLSTSGMTGTLRRRLNSKLLKGYIHAKTGYIANVRTLSGYIDTLGGKRLAFVIFANNYGERLQNAENIIDSACLIMRKLK